MTRLLIPLILAFGLVGIAVMPAQAGDIRSERVQFPKGEIGATIKDRIKGRETVDYRLRARAGQRMNVGLYTDNPSSYFNVIAPGETDVAFFVGANEGNEFEGELPESGDYRIRVYLYRNAARRGETANYRLEVAIAAAGDVPSEADGTSNVHPSQRDALVAGTEFHATGEIPCARYQGQPMRSCRFGVIRRDNGSATVKVLWPGGGERYLYFENGKATSSDSDSGAGIVTERESDLNKVFNGTNERFEIPDAVLYGG